MNSLAIRLNRLELPNPVLVASGTFGYAKEMADFVDFAALGGIIPKTVTPQRRPGNAPPRTVETACGMLNSIGLDNDGFDEFVEHKLPDLLALGAPIIVNIAARTTAEFQRMADVLNAQHGIAAVELNISCPNVSGGVDFGTDPQLAGEVVAAVRSTGDLPVIAKLTPNVTSVVPVAQAVADERRDGRAEARVRHPANVADVPQRRLRHSLHAAFVRDAQHAGEDQLRQRRPVR